MRETMSPLAAPPRASPRDAAQARTAGTGSQLSQFTRALAAFTRHEFADHADLHAFSVRDWRGFWHFFVRWCGDALGVAGADEPVCEGDSCETARFFPGLRLNYAASLLSVAVAPADAPALTEVHAGGGRRSWSRGELREEVERLARALSALGIRPGDRVVAVLRNDARAVVTALAVAAIGATLSSVAPDMGLQAMRDRFAPLAPRLLVAHAAPRPWDAGAPLPEKLAALLDALPSVRHVLVLDSGTLDDTHGRQLLSFDAAGAAAAGAPFAWATFDFNHPLFIMFSSGTTGRPKCIVHGAGGTLLEHVKEHRLHTDLRRGDRMYFHTSCAWMMWNWQLSALASGAEIVTYDGPISEVDCLWRLVADEAVTVFGTSPGYLKMGEAAGLEPGQAFDLSALRAVLSTGAVLHDHQFHWVREHVKDVPVQSISGGTDIIGCFVLGHPDLPVVPGEAQCASLGLDVQSWQDGAPASGIGELVCVNPFPSRPIGFVGDPDGAAFHAAYFSRNPGVWTHGDLIEFSPHGGARLHGRTDGVLNARGVKFAPMEIYRVLDTIPDIVDAMVVEQRAPRGSGSGGWRGEQRIVALLVLRERGGLDPALATQVRRAIANHLSPAHVPDAMLAVPELPVTYSGKPSEAAARAAVNGESAPNTDALRNPGCLDAIRTQAAALSPPDGSGVDDDGDGRPLPERLRSLWRRHLGLQQVGLDDNFFELGGKSLGAVLLLEDVERVTGRTLGLGALMHAPTVSQLVAMIDGADTASASSTLVPMRPGTGRPLFILHSHSGTIVEMWNIVWAMRCARPVWGLQAQGIDGERPPQDRVEEMAATYIAQIRSIQPEGPYALCGYSFGGSLAFEVARQLHQAGESIELVCLLDPYLRHALSWRTAAWQVRARVTARCSRLRRAEVAGFVALTGKRLALECSSLLGLRQRPRPSEGLGLSPARQAVFDAIATAIERYRPAPYSGGPVVYLRATQPLGGFFDPLPAWQRLARAGLEIVQLPGGHYDVTGRSAPLVASQLDARLGAPPPAAHPDIQDTRTNFATEGMPLARMKSM